eukprot:gene8621-34064_t
MLRSNEVTPTKSGRSNETWVRAQVSDAKSHPGSAGAQQAHSPAQPTLAPPQEVGSISQGKANVGSNPSNQNDVASPSPDHSRQDQSPRGLDMASLHSRWSHLSSDMKLNSRNASDLLMRHAAQSSQVEELAEYLFAGPAQAGADTTPPHPQRPPHAGPRRAGGLSGGPSAAPQNPRPPALPLRPPPLPRPPEPPRSIETLP